VPLPKSICDSRMGLEKYGRKYQRGGDQQTSDKASHDR
jgi:hypothetical protein